jgi:hypothetical protein
MKGSPKTRAAALVAAGVVAGGVLAGTLSAAAATGGTSTTSATPTATAPPAGGQMGPGPGHGAPDGAQPVRSDEKLVTGTNASTLRSAALAKVPGGTVVRVETDSGDGAYEAHMTKADGSLVTVKFDKNLEVTSVEDGMGK